MNSKPYRRTKKLVNSRLQLHLVAVFASLACLSSLFQVVVLNRSILSLAEDSGIAASELSERLPGLLFGNLALTLAALLPLMLVVGVLVTHRIAGPLYRFEQHFGAIARGEDPGVCRIRKGDELQELCNVLNAAVDKLKEQGGSESTSTTSASSTQAATSDVHRAAA